MAKCIIFDCDGVLVDSEATTIRILAEIAAEHGYAIAMKDALAQYSGQSLQYCVDDINRNASRTLPANIREIFRERTFAAYQSNLLPVPHIHEVLEILQQPKCVASNGPLDKIRMNLGLIDALHYFEGIYSAYEIEKWKPEPDLFWHAAREMGYAPKECIVVEDSVAGVKAAVAGGFEVYAYANDRTADDLDRAGGKVIFSMRDLLSIK